MEWGGGKGMRKPSLVLAQWLINQGTMERPAALSKHARKNVVGKQIAAWAMRSLCINLSYSQIANRVGYSDHTLALHAFNRVESMRALDADFCAKTDALLERARTEQAEILNVLNPDDGRQARSAHSSLIIMIADARQAAERLNLMITRLEAAMDAGAEQ
jgi:hypothetical protein